MDGVRGVNCIALMPNITSFLKISRLSIETKEGDAFAAY
jgi:hypothetical protein